MISFIQAISRDCELSTPHLTSRILLNLKIYILFEWNHSSSCNHSLNFEKFLFFSASSTTLKRSIVLSDFYFNLPSSMLHACHF